MMTPSLSSSLLFCLFSFLFGGLSLVLRECLRGCLCALRLLPPPSAKKPMLCRRGIAQGMPSFCEAAEQKAEEPQPPKNKKSEERKGSPKKEKLFFFGYLLLDLLFFALFGILYMLFLYAENEGIFRVYAFLLTALGFFLARRLVKNRIAVPIYTVLSLPHFLLGAVLALFRSAFLRSLRFFHRKRKKDGQQLDEKGKIV